MVNYALGDVVRTMTPIPIIVFNNKASAYTTPAAGDPTGTDASGDLIIAVNTTDGPLMMLTNMTHVVSGTTYYGTLVWGIGVMQCGASAIKPNKYVAVNSSSLVAPVTTTVNTAFVQGDIQILWRILGMFLSIDGDNQFNPSDAASTNNILIFVGRTP